MKTKSRSFKVLMLILLSFVLLVTVSFAWFYIEGYLEGNTIETNSLTYKAYGYDATGKKVSTLLNDGQASTDTETPVNAPLFSQAKFNKGSSTVYVSIELESTSIDLEYNLSIIAKGYSSGELNFTDLGGYWYRITDITSKVSSLSTYISDGNTETGTELNMNTINTSTTFGTIKSSDTSKIKYYRIDFGVNSNATTAQVTNNRIELFGKVEVNQINNTSTSQGAVQEHVVTDATSLEKAIEKANNSDSLYFTNNVEYEGDLIIRKCLNLNLGGKTLIVTGNLIYNFASANTLKIDVTGNGLLKVLSSNQANGNLIFETPNAQIEILGTAKGGLIIEKDIIISCANDDNKMGCHLSGVNALKTDGEPATIVLKSNTSVAISSGVKIDSITSYLNSNNVKIINYGTINNINLSNMKSTTQTASPQIYINNYYDIINIVLPSWSKKFELKSDGNNTGNTRISNSFGATVTNLSGSSNFSKDDILKVSEDIFVESVDGTDNNLRILFKNKPSSPNTATTIEGLLKEYFNSLGKTSSTDLTNSYKAITRLEIDSVKGKNFESADLTFLKSDNLSGLKTLDLADANFKNNTLPKNFYTKTYLRELILPKNLIRIEGYAFGTDVIKGFNIKSLTVPASVVSLGTGAFRNIRYVTFESVSAPKLDTKVTSTDLNELGCKYVFVPQDSVESYELAFNNALPANVYNRLYFAAYPYATLADDGVHFIRSLSDGTYELVTADIIPGNQTNVSNVINNGEYVIGKDITVGGKPITISTIGRCAYINIANRGDATTHSYNVSFVESVVNLEYRGFDNSKFNIVDFSYIENFAEFAGRDMFVTTEIRFSHGDIIEGYHSFIYATAPLLDTGSVTEIRGSLVFQETEIVEIRLPNVVRVGPNAIYNNSKLEKIYTPKVEVIESQGIAYNAILYEINLPSIKELGYEALRRNYCLYSLYLGPNLTYVGTNPLASCALQYLFVETPNYVSLQSLLPTSSSGIKEPITVGKIFVTATAYDEFYTNLSTENKANLYEFGVNKVGVATETIFNGQNPLIEDYNVGEYLVRLEKEGAIIVSYNVAEEASNYTIPKTVEVNGKEYPVIGVGINAFRGRTNMTTLNAPSIISAGKSAFEGCSNLVTANIPMLKHWSANLFNNCPKLDKIVSECQFTSDATAITTTTANLKNITIDYEVYSSADLPATTVFSGLKSKCANVVLYVKARCLNIFKANSVFNELLPASLEQQVTDANGNIYYLTKITINSTVYYQVDYVVGNGSNLIIPAAYGGINVVCAREGAYDGVTASSIEIPANYKYIKDKEFSKVNGLTSFIVDSSNTTFGVSNGVLYSKEKVNEAYIFVELVCYPNSKTESPYTIDSATLVVRSSAFENVKYLTNIEFNSSIKYIGVDAFKGSTVSTFTFSGTTAPYLLGDNALGSSVTKIDVPNNKIDAYKKVFRNYINYIQ